MGDEGGSGGRGGRRGKGEGSGDWGPPPCPPPLSAQPIDWVRQRLLVPGFIPARKTAYTTNS